VLLLLLLLLVMVVVLLVLLLVLLLLVEEGMLLQLRLLVVRTATGDGVLRPFRPSHFATSPHRVR
jgi:hypothetical protein